MKAKLLLLIVLLLCSWTNVNKPMTSGDKEKTIQEVKGLISTIYQSCEKPDPVKLISTFPNSPDFVSLVGGVYAEYDQSIKNVDGFFKTINYQKITIRSEKYVVLDATTVLYTSNSRCETKLKNDSTTIMDPLGLQLLLKKIDNHWKVLSWTESY